MRPAARTTTWRAAALLLCLLFLLGAAGASPGASARGRLLRVPKVYNALITSNEPLLPSRTEQATVGQVLYYPPHPHPGYPASAGPLILPQVAAAQQAPPAPALYDPSQQQPPQQGAQQDGQQDDQQDGPPLELHVQPGLTQEQVAVAQEQDQATPWPVVYASDVLQQQQQQVQQGPQAARAVQTVEEVARPGEYQPPPTVDIDSIKNNRPAGIRDVPPPPLPVGRGNRDGHRPQPVPPGLLPF